VVGNPRRNALFGVVLKPRGLQGLDGGGSRAQTGDPPPSHRTGLRHRAGNRNLRCRDGRDKGRLIAWQRPIQRTRRGCEKPLFRKKKPNDIWREWKIRTCDPLRPEPGLPNAANDLSGLIDAKNREHGKERGGLAVPKLCHCTAAYGVRFRTNVHFCAFLPERFPDFRVMPLGRNKSAGKYSVRQAAQATL